jgi:hypothetical protein
MFDRMATWLIARAKRTPYFHLPGYMNRYWIVPFANADGRDGCYVASWRRNPFVWLCQLLGVSIRVHEIIRSDDGKFFHDHPASFISVILRNGYWEIRPKFRHGMYVGDSARYYSAGNILFRRFSDWHRLEFAQGLEQERVYTLFVMLRWRQKWGYLTQPQFKQYYREVHGLAAAKLPEIR